MVGRPLFANYKNNLHDIVTHLTPIRRLRDCGNQLSFDQVSSSLSDVKQCRISILLNTIIPISKKYIFSISTKKNQKITFAADQNKSEVTMCSENSRTKTLKSICQNHNRQLCSRCRLRFPPFHISVAAEAQKMRCTPTGGITS